MERSDYENLVLKLCLTPISEGMATRHLLRRTLWLMETSHYVETGEVLTGDRYVRTPDGIEPVCLNDIIGALIERQNVVPLTLDDGTEVLFPVSGVNDTQLDHEIESLAEGMLHLAINGHEANPVVEGERPAWAIAAVGEDVPINAAIASQQAPINDDDVTWAMQKVS